MNKKLEKGFSLVELLVVVAIIGVLAGVGIVGYQSYTESAKEKVAEANYNSVVRFIETELTLLNNGVQENSGALKDHGTTAGTCNGTAALPRAGTTQAKLANSIACHFKDLKFKNPFDNNDQVKFATPVGASPAPKKGEIYVFDGTGATTSTNNRPINIIYFTAAGAIGAWDSSTNQYGGTNTKQKVDLGLAN